MPKDHIRLNEIVLFAHLGVTEAEREVGQRIHMDIEMELDLEKAARTDTLAKTVSYEAVYREVESIVDASRYRLMEALAGELIDQILERFPVDGVRVRMRKPNVPFAGSLASAEVELRRKR